MFGHRDQQRLPKEHRARGTPDMFGVTLPEIHGQVHPLAVLLLHLVPAATATQRQMFSSPDCSERGRVAEAQLENLHKDVVFFHYLVEGVISPVDFMEPVIVNVRHHHLDRGEQGREQPEQIVSARVRTGGRFWCSKYMKCSHSLEQHRRVWTRRSTDL